MSMKPILFNTEMVRAILDGRKTVTRRVVKPQPENVLKVRGIDIARNDKMFEFLCASSDGSRDYIEGIKMPYQIGDILYVRETWCIEPKSTNGYGYKANRVAVSDGPWRPSIHMPKSAARLFLRVTNVSVAKLQDIQERGAGSAQQEGFVNDIDLNRGTGKSATKRFAELWDSTVKKKDIDLYGWCANPWVWIIEFERISKG